MNDLSNHYALSRAQARWDGMEPDYDDRPDPVLEARDERIRVLENNVELLTYELLEAAERLNRKYPCAGDRFIKTCNKIKGIKDDE